jgi:hypothetical protein
VVEKTPKMRINDGKVGVLHIGELILRDICCGIQRLNLFVIPQRYPLSDAPVSHRIAEINERNLHFSYFQQPRLSQKARRSH